MTISQTLEEQKMTILLVRNNWKVEKMKEILGEKIKLRRNDYYLKYKGKVLVNQDSAYSKDINNLDTI